MLEDLDTLAKKAKDIVGKESYLKYLKQREDGYFDTKVRVNTTTQYFNNQIEEGSKDVKKDA